MQVVNLFIVFVDASLLQGIKHALEQVIDVPLASVGWVSGQVDLQPLLERTTIDLAPRQTQDAALNVFLVLAASLAQDGRAAIVPPVLIHGRWPRQL